MQQQQQTQCSVKTQQMQQKHTQSPSEQSHLFRSLECTHTVAPALAEQGEVRQRQQQLPPNIPSPIVPFQQPCTTRQLPFKVVLSGVSAYTVMYTQKHTYTHTHTRSRSLSLSLTHTLTHTHTHARTHIHTYLLTDSLSLILSLILFISHAHSLTHSHTHTHTHTTYSFLLSLLVSLSLAHTPTHMYQIHMSTST